MLQIRIITILSVCILVSSQREDWLDPLDFHSYDHVNKVMRTATERVSTDTSDVSQKDHSIKTKEEYTYDMLMAKLQRQTALILQAADLMDTDTEESYYTQRYMLLSLTSVQLKSLQKFAKYGKLDLDEVDDAWQSMWTLLNEPGYTKWDWIAKWLPLNMFSVSKENFVLCLEVCVVALPFILIIMKMPVLRAMFLFILLVFSVSVVIRYHRITQADEMRQRHLIVKPEEMPIECRPSHMRNIWETFLHYFSTSNDAAKCKKYYESTFTDPLLHTTPLEQMVLIITDIFIQVLEKIGEALNKFTNQVFVDLPWPLNIIVGSLTNLVMVVLVLVIFILLIWISIKYLIIRMFHVDFWTKSSKQTSQETITRDRAPSQITITNHGHLVFDNKSAGLEFIDSKSQPLLLRSQSASGIIYSSQSTSTTELNQLEVDNRGRSNSGSELPGSSKYSVPSTSSNNKIVNSAINYCNLDSEDLEVVNEENETESRASSFNKEFDQENKIDPKVLCSNGTPCNGESSKLQKRVTPFVPENVENIVNKENNSEFLVTRENSKFVAIITPENNCFLTSEINSELDLSCSVTPEKLSTSPESLNSSMCGSLSPPPCELSNLLTSMTMEDPFTEVENLSSPKQKSDKNNEN